MGFEFQRQGILCVVSGPSGSGKTTLCRGLSESDPHCSYAVSCTTRSPRKGETDGKDYHFLDRADFLERSIRGDLLEWAEVHGNLYGTLKSSVLEQIESGTDVLIDIDVQGATLIRKSTDCRIRESLVDVFVLPPDREELLHRLDKRGTEEPEELEIRLENALEEMRHWKEYAYTIVSGSPEEDLSRFQSIIEAERHRSRRLQTREHPETHPDLFE